MAEDLFSGIDAGKKCIALRGRRGAWAPKGLPGQKILQDGQASRPEFITARRPVLRESLIHDPLRPLHLGGVIFRRLWKALPDHVRSHFRVREEDAPGR